MINFPILPPFKITQGFGENLLPLYQSLGYLGHNGIDIVPLKDWNVYATHDGIAYQKKDPGGYGNYIELVGPPDSDGNVRYSVFAHLEFMYFPDGKFAKMGQVLGHVGNTGNSTGPHLHWTYKVKNAGKTLHLDNGYRGALDVIHDTAVWYPFFIIPNNIKGSTIVHNAMARGAHRRTMNASHIES
jgi:murein DD-endopeptidase MepM/ murein hydrolase activator NlpD